jgi:hypothetical protein
MVDATPTFMISLRCAARATRIGAFAIGRFDAVGSCGEKIYVTGSGTPAKFVKGRNFWCGTAGDFGRQVNVIAGSAVRRSYRVSDCTRRRSQPQERSGVQQA